MKIFIYKSLFIFLCLFILFKFTIGYKIDQYEEQLDLLKSDFGRELIRNKFRKEVKKTIDKEQILSPEDRVLFKKLISKLKNELN